MASSIPAQHALQDLRDHDLRIHTVSLCDKTGAIDLCSSLRRWRYPRTSIVLYIKSKMWQSG